ncbi:oxalate:formate antiporter [Clostridium sp. Cult2]|nr:OFA family MFS transporter [Clostridium sp. Cult2]MCF6465039.1 oxalate:formate antiporter [Clostridium sp. Cult2]
MEKNIKSKGLVVLGAATGINFVSGVLYTWSVISKALITQLNWTSKEASLPYTIATISFVIAMVIFGRVQDQKGPKLTGTIGGVLMGLGFILSGFTTNPNMMILTVGIIAGVGIGTLNASTTPPTVKWFPPEKKGLITGIVVAGVGLSSILYSPLANYIMNIKCVSITFIYIGMIGLIVSVVLAQFLKNPPEGYKPISKRNPRENNNISFSNRDYEWKEMIKTTNFYKLWLMLGLSSSAGLMITGHITNIAKVQINWESGFLLVILLALFNTFGRLLGGSMSDKIGRINTMRIIFILQGINMFLFSKYMNIGLMSVGVAIAGLCYGAGFAIFPSATSDLYGTKNFGVNYGLIYTGWGLGGTIGPMTGAAIFDSTQSYNKAYIVAFILLILSVLITYTIKSPRESMGIEEKLN